MRPTADLARRRRNCRRNCRHICRHNCRRNCWRNCRRNCWRNCRRNCWRVARIFGRWGAQSIPSGTRTCTETTVPAQLLWGREHRTTIGTTIRSRRHPCAKVQKIFGVRTPGVDSEIFLKFKICYEYLFLKNYYECFFFKITTSTFFLKFTRNILKNLNKSSGFHPGGGFAVTFKPWQRQRVLALRRRKLAQLPRMIRLHEEHAHSGAPQRSCVCGSLPTG